MAYMLGSSLYFSIAFKVGCLDKLWGRFFWFFSKCFWNFQFFFYIRKKIVRLFANSTLSDKISSFFRKVIFFSQKEIVLQSARTSCYQWYSFHLICKILLSFLRRDTQKFLCLIKANLYPFVGIFKNPFLRHVLSMIDLEVLVMKSLLFSRMYFFFLEHYDSIHFDIYWKISLDF